MVEVRVITYKRPKLLERALRSLAAQSYQDWKAIVFDDSGNFESQEVVSRLGDARIVARMNPRNLGMILNLSQSFAAQPYFIDSTHACILEDDNAFEPRWLEENLVAMQKTRHAVMVRNYRMVDVLENGTFVPNPGEPMRELYGDVPRELSLEERVREAFYNFTLGTSCFFWDLRQEVDLSFQEERLNGPVMEAGRAICFREPCWYEPEPLSIFSRFICKAQTHRSESPASTRMRRVSKVSEIQFTRRLMRMWTRDFGHRLAAIVDGAESRKDGIEALQRLAEAGSLAALIRLKNARRWLKALKSIGVFRLYGRAWSEASGTNARDRSR